MSAERNYRALVTILLEDVDESIMRRIFAEGRTYECLVDAYSYEMTVEVISTIEETTP